MKFKELLQKNELFDSHCHLNANEYEQDRSDVVLDSINSGITVVDIGTDLESSKNAIETAKTFPEKVYASAGIDPEVFIPGSGLYVEDGSLVYQDFESLISLIENNLEHVMLVGETGLDNYWNKKNEIDSDISENSFEYQKELFKKHIKISKLYDLPLSIHSREAVDECIEILERYTPEDITGIFHSLTPELDDTVESFEDKVWKILEMGYLISINGIVTYKTASLLRNTIIKILKSKIQISNNRKLEPLDFYEAGFVFETDGPYLSPEGKRGQRNEPKNVKEIYEFIRNLI